MPASITALSKEQFIDQAWDVVGRKVSKARLLGDIYETARSSIGAGDDGQSRNHHVSPGHRQRT